MILIIDAYNVLKQVLSERIGEREREQFIKQLSAYARTKGHKIILVFDGGPQDRPSQERVQGIYVVYAGLQSADDYIIEYVERQRSLDILVVSSDRRVCAASSRLEIPSLDSSEFYKILMHTSAQVPVSKKNEETVKISSTADEELDILMEETMVQSKQEDLSGGSTRKSAARPLSKHEKQMLKKIKKL